MGAGGRPRAASDVPRGWRRRLRRRGGQVQRHRLARRAGGGRRHADAATTEDQRPFEDRRLLEARCEARPRAQGRLGDRLARREEGPAGGVLDRRRRGADRRLERGRRCGGGRRWHAARPGDAEHSPGLRRVDRLPRLVGDREDRREQEERQAGGQEQVADRGDVLQGWDRQRDEVAERPQVQEELRAEGRGQRHVERGPQRPGESGRLVGGHPDRHVAAVDHDHERVARHADERQRHARIRAVLPQREQQEAVRRGRTAGRAARRRR